MEAKSGSPQCSRGEMYFNVGQQALVVLLGAAALRKKPGQLAALLLGWVLNLTVFRFNTCMNCDYYGEDCHLGWGRFTARFFKRKKEPDRGAFQVSHKPLLPAAALRPPHAGDEEEPRAPAGLQCLVGRGEREHLGGLQKVRHEGRVPPQREDGEPASFVGITASSR
jgi:hypothetical protein